MTESSVVPEVVYLEDEDWREQLHIQLTRFGKVKLAHKRNGEEARERLFRKEAKRDGGDVERLYLHLWRSAHARDRSHHRSSGTHEEREAPLGGQWRMPSAGPVEFLEPEYADPNDPMPEVTADDQFIADDGSLHDTFEAWFDRQEDLGVWDGA